MPHVLRKAKTTQNICLYDVFSKQNICINIVSVDPLTKHLCLIRCVEHYSRDKPTKCKGVTILPKL